MARKAQKRVNFLFTNSEETQYIAFAKTVMQDIVLNKLLARIIASQVTRGEG